jgi:hypothetical protein
MELEYFKKYCTVEVWDISELVNPTFSRSISSPRSNKSEVKSMSSLAEIGKQLKDIKFRSAQNKCCILSALSRETFYELQTISKIARILKNTGIPIFEIYNGGIPVYYPDSNGDTQEGTSIFLKLKNLLRSTTSFAELKKTVTAIGLTKLSNILPDPVTHRLVAGDHYLAIAEKKEKPRYPVQLIFGHCQDYSNTLLNDQNKKKSPVKEHTAVLLDAPGPMFTSDYTVLKRKKIFLTTEVWYPLLTRFFDTIEKETGTRVKIAGHYKSTHPSIAACFGNREVHYHKTKELVENSDLIITRSSAAISYAVLFRKPILFIYSNQLLEDELGMYHTMGLAKMLGAKTINIDAPPAKLLPFLKVNESCYAAYEKACLSSSDTRRPNVQIILENIMHINTGSDFNSDNPGDEKLIIAPQIN